MGARLIVAVLGLLLCFAGSAYSEEAWRGAWKASPIKINKWNPDSTTPPTEAVSPCTSTVITHDCITAMIEGFHEKENVVQDKADQYDLKVTWTDLYPPYDLGSFYGLEKEDVVQTWELRGAIQEHSHLKFQDMVPLYP